MNPTRGDKTKLLILKTGLQMWKENPTSVNAYSISKRIKMTHGSIMYHFPYGVRDAVANYALEVKDPIVIGQLIAVGDPLVRDMSPSDKTEYMRLAAERF